MPNEAYFCALTQPMSLYARRGVSSQKDEVHKATANLSHGLYPHAFCKLFPDFLGNDENWVNVMHADGAGTKSILAYLYWKETGDATVWKGIAQDAVVMNLDDLLCVGVHDNILFSSTIDRNKRLIPGEVLEQIINGTQELFDALAQFGVHIHFLGGETADVGDVVQTIAVNGTMTARWPKEKLITNEKIRPGDVIVGFASDGRSTYESDYNSGIGSNGLTSARHDLLQKSYATNYRESYDNGIEDSVLYIGPYRLTDSVSVTVSAGIENIPVGKLLLSPTRTYAPLVKTILAEMPGAVHGIIHCSGGGQTKCMKYLPGPFRVIKDNLFEPPAVFRLIQQYSVSDNREMYQVFNMGHRLELFTGEDHAAGLIEMASGFGIPAQVVGRVTESETASLVLRLPGGDIEYPG